MTRKGAVFGTIRAGGDSVLKGTSAPSKHQNKSFSSVIPFLSLVGATEAQVTD